MEVQAEPEDLQNPDEGVAIAEETAVYTTQTPTGGKVKDMVLRIGSELIGSFLIFFAIYCVGIMATPLSNINMAFIALSTGLAYGVVTYMFGRISGGHFNPAITVASMLGMKTKWLDGILYIIAQLLGALAAGGLMRLIIPTGQSLTAKMLLPYVVNGFNEISVSAGILKGAGASFDVKTAVIVEVVASILVIIAAMMTMNKKDSSNGIQAMVMGGAYALGTSFTYMITGSGMNPARSTGIAVAAMGLGLDVEPVKQLWVFWVCPILAAALVTIFIVIREMLSTSSPADAIADTNSEADQADAAIEEMSLEGSQCATPAEDETAMENAAASDQQGI
ncbi:glycerol transporter [Bifidobacterium aemilianum]|uniref:Glycerol transporter n=1 Tax=Bifidobacterium aemilianum TaxID=2493120 RepID=A0A366K8J1_9BIFI|nr:aquaporin [Bifidobacterium aemilianum]RBP98060.1 glycerol transporter [Bifidobacterium aemilianum]